MKLCEFCVPRRPQEKLYEDLTIQNMSLLQGEYDSLLRQESMETIELLATLRKRRDVSREIQELQYFHDESNKILLHLPPDDATTSALTKERRAAMLRRRAISGGLPRVRVRVGRLVEALRNTMTEKIRAVAEWLEVNGGDARKSPRMRHDELTSRRDLARDPPNRGKLRESEKRKDDEMNEHEVLGALDANRTSKGGAEVHNGRLIRPSKGTSLQECDEELEAERGDERLLRRLNGWSLQENNEESPRKNDERLGGDLARFKWSDGSVGDAARASRTGEDELEGKLKGNGHERKARKRDVGIKGDVMKFVNKRRKNDEKLEGKDSNERKELLEGNGHDRNLRKRGEANSIGNVQRRDEGPRDKPVTFANTQLVADVEDSEDETDNETVDNLKFHCRRLKKYWNIPEAQDNLLRLRKQFEAASRQLEREYGVIVSSMQLEDLLANDKMSMRHQGTKFWSRIYVKRQHLNVRKVIFTMQGVASMVDGVLLLKKRGELERFASTSTSTYLPEKSARSSKLDYLDLVDEEVEILHRVKALHGIQAEEDIIALNLVLNRRLEMLVALKANDDESDDEQYSAAAAAPAFNPVKIQRNVQASKKQRCEDDDPSFGPARENRNDEDDAPSYESDSVNQRRNDDDGSLYKPNSKTKPRKGVNDPATSSSLQKMPNKVISRRPRNPEGLDFNVWNRGNINEFYKCAGEPSATEGEKSFLNAMIRRCRVVSHVLETEYTMQVSPEVVKETLGNYHLVVRYRNLRLSQTNFRFSISSNLRGPKIRSRMAMAQEVFQILSTNKEQGEI